MFDVGKLWVFQKSISFAIAAEVKMCLFLVENRKKQNPKMNSNSNALKLSQTPDLCSELYISTTLSWFWILVSTCLFLLSAGRVNPYLHKKEIEFLPTTFDLPTL